MNRHSFLSAVHAAYQPRTYLEIGVNDGRGLKRSKTRTIGVDPDYRITAELACDLQLVRATSDDFFAGANPMAHFPEGVVDLTFIDGLHLFEFALRDFMNAERFSTPNSVIILDDMLPRSAPEAARDRFTSAWTGDVFKVAPVLGRYRPGLTLIPLDTEPTGLLLVLGLDPASTTLEEHYDEIIADFVTPDPQQLPEDIVHRTFAAHPAKVLKSPIWTELAAARDGGRPAEGIEALRDLRGTSSYVSDPPDPGVWSVLKNKRPTRAPSAWDQASRTAARAARRAKKAITERRSTP